MWFPGQTRTKRPSYWTPAWGGTVKCSMRFRRFFHTSSWRFGVKLAQFEISSILRKQPVQTFSSLVRQTLTQGEGSAVDGSILEIKCQRRKIISWWIWARAGAALSRSSSLGAGVVCLFNPCVLSNCKLCAYLKVSHAECTHHFDPIKELSSNLHKMYVFYKKAVHLWTTVLSKSQVLDSTTLRT